jgi:hypothetical protein
VYPNLFRFHELLFFGFKKREKEEGGGAFENLPGGRVELPTKGL